MPRTTMRIDDGLFEQLRTRARKRRTTIQDEVNEALRQELARPADAVEPLVLDAREAGPIVTDLGNREVLLDILGDR